MPEKVDDCVASVLEDNPDYSESRAYAICKAEMQADADAVEVATLDTLGTDAAAMDEFADATSDWQAQEDVWVNEAEQLIVYDGDAVPDQQAEGFAADVFRIVQAEDGEMDLEGDVMGIGVDFPNAGVYADWRIDAWPDDEQLEDPHVSDYGSIEDLEQATGGVVESLQTVSANSDDRDGADEQMAGLEQQAEVDAVMLHFPPGGEVIDHDEGDWDAFLDDLSKHGDVFQMWKGLQRHPEDNLESHDHATFVALEADSDVSDIEDVLDEHPAVRYVIDAGSVPPMSKPDGWDPESSEHVPTPDQEMVTFSGLSQEAVDAIERRYNTAVVDGEAPAAPTDS